MSKMSVAGAQELGGLGIRRWAPQASGAWRMQPYQPLHQGGVQSSRLAAQCGPFALKHGLHLRSPLLHAALINDFMCGCWVGCPPHGQPAPTSTAHTKRDTPGAHTPANMPVHTCRAHTRHAHVLGTHTPRCTHPAHMLAKAHRAAFFPTRRGLAQATG